jgi:hypothetical protein
MRNMRADLETRITGKLYKSDYPSPLAAQQQQHAMTKEQGQRQPG